MIVSFYLLTLSGSGVMSYMEDVVALQDNKYSSSFFLMTFHHNAYNVWLFMPVV